MRSMPSTTAGRGGTYAQDRQALPPIGRRGAAHGGRLSFERHHCGSTHNLQWLVDPDPQNGTGRQIRVAALGRGNRAAAADQNPDERSPRAAEETADNRAHHRGGTDARHVVPHLAVERLGHGRAQPVRPVADAKLVERERQAAAPIDAGPPPGPS